MSQYDSQMMTDDEDKTSHTYRFELEKRLNNLHKKWNNINVMQSSWDSQISDDIQYNNREHSIAKRELDWDKIGTFSAIGIGSGAAVGLYFGGPMGAAIGGLIGGAAGGLYSWLNQK